MKTSVLCTAFLAMAAFPTSVALAPLLVKRLRRALRLQHMHEEADAKAHLQQQQEQNKEYHAFLDDLYIHKVQDDWKEELDHLKHYEHSVLSDPDLAGIVEADPLPPQTLYREREQHRHDSLVEEAVHAIETDPDLANIVGDNDDDHKKVNPQYRQAESHRHDSLWNEIEHSIESDPDLSP